MISTILNDNISIFSCAKTNILLKIGYKITFICRITEKISIKLRVQLVAGRGYRIDYETLQVGK